MERLASVLLNIAKTFFMRNKARCAAFCHKIRSSILRGEDVVLGVFKANRWISEFRYLELQKIAHLSKVDNRLN